MTRFQIEIDKKHNTVHLQFHEVTDKSERIMSLSITVPEAYMLCSDLLRELDKSNPLLADSE